MLKREAMWIFIFVLFFGIFVSGVYAIDLDSNEVDDDLETSSNEEIVKEESDSGNTENTADVLEGVDEEFKDAQLNEGAGITPDSAFYFVEDGILSKFRGALENREKKIAEVREMIKEG